MRRRQSVARAWESASCAEEALGRQPGDSLRHGVDTLAAVLAPFLQPHGLADDEPADEPDRLGREGRADPTVEGGRRPLVVATQRAGGEDLRDGERGCDAVSGVT